MQSIEMYLKIHLKLLQEQYLMFLRGLSLLPTLSEYFIKLDCFMIHQQASKLIRPDRRRLKAQEKIAIKILYYCRHKVQCLLIPGA